MFGIAPETGGERKIGVAPATGQGEKSEEQDCGQLCKLRRFLIGLGRPAAVATAAQDGILPHIGRLHGSGIRNFKPARGRGANSNCRSAFRERARRYGLRRGQPQHLKLFQRVGSGEVKRGRCRLTETSRPRSSFQVTATRVAPACFCTLCSASRSICSTSAVVPAAGRGGRWSQKRHRNPALLLEGFDGAPGRGHQAGASHIHRRMLWRNTRRSRIGIAPASATP